MSEPRIVRDGDLTSAAWWDTQVGDGHGEYDFAAARAALPRARVAAKAAAAAVKGPGVRKKPGMYAVWTLALYVILGWIVLSWIFMPADKPVADKVDHRAPLSDFRLRYNPATGKLEPAKPAAAGPLHVQYWGKDANGRLVKLDGPAKPADTGTQTAPAAGTIEQGYRFKGSDPANPANWEKAEQHCSESARKMCSIIDAMSEVKSYARQRGIELTTEDLRVLALSDLKGVAR